MELIYVVVDEKGKKYGGFRNIDDVEEFRLNLFMEYGLDSFSYECR